MKILVTNDDGISAEGLNSLAKILSTEHEVYVIAPDSEKSACSNAITVRDELKFKKISKNRFSVSGFPADCVNIGLHSGLIPEIDMVVSGINHGSNIGDDLYFSGTVAAARTAYIFEKTGIAVSMDSFHKASENFDDASRVVLKFIDEISEEISIEPMLFNINFPNIPSSEIKGVKYTHAGKRKYNDSYTRKHINDLEMSLKLNGVVESINHNGSDAKAISEGYISITPLIINCADFAYLEKKNGIRSHVRD